MPDTGDVVRGRYELLRRVGDGGMGTVFEARHLLLGTSVALKLLHPHLARREEFTQRFLREAQMSAQIHHPNVVRAIDVDRTDDGLPFMVMEYVVGDTLLQRYERLRSEGRWLSAAEALGLFRQLLDGVGAAHDHGMVHRDMKPENVMLEPQPEGGELVKILDFGVAKLNAPGVSEARLTQPGAVMGTPEYMAPEQAVSPGSVDHRADVFALGVLLFEMLAAQRPVADSTVLGMTKAYLDGDVRRLDELVPDLAPGLAAVVHRAIDGDVEARFETVASFAAALAPFTPRHEARPSTRPPPSQVPPTQIGEPILERSRPNELEPAAKPRRWPLRLAVVFVVTALLAAGVLTRKLWLPPKPKIARAGAMNLVLPASAIPPVPPAPKPPSSIPTHPVGGSFAGWRVMVEHSIRRDSTGRIALALRAWPTGVSAPATQTAVNLSLSYFSDHRVTSYERSVEPVAVRSTHDVTLDRDGKYHLTARIRTASHGDVAFRCDLCIGPNASLCPALRSRCAAVSGGHQH